MRPGQRSLRFTRSLSALVLQSAILLSLCCKSKSLSLSLFTSLSLFLYLYAYSVHLLGISVEVLMLPILIFLFKDQSLLKNAYAEQRWFIFFFPIVFVQISQISRFKFKELHYYLITPPVIKKVLYQAHYWLYLIPYIIIIFFLELLSAVVFTRLIISNLPDSDIQMCEQLSWKFRKAWSRGLVRQENITVIWTWKRNFVLRFGVKMQGKK